MEAKEKAVEIFNKVDYLVNGDINKRNHKDLAIYVCDEIIEVLDDLEKTDTGVINNSWGQDDWIDVKNEIDKL